MTEVSDTVLKRIRSLLAMSRGKANENEAAIAAQKAQEMLTQFNLSQSDVEGSDPGNIIEDGDLMTSSSNPWRRSLAHAVARVYLCDYYFNFVKHEALTRKCGYIRLDRHNFIGLAHNVVVAKEMFVYLVDTIERLAKESRATQKQTHAYEHAFRHGCATRLTNRLWDRYNQQTAPPVGLLTKSGVPALYKGMDSRILDFLAKNHTDLVAKPSRGKHSSWEGVIDGNKAGDTIGLDDQLQTTAAPKAITSMAYYIQERKAPGAKYTMGRNARPFKTYGEAKAMLDDLDEHGGCGPLRIVNERGEVQTDAMHGVENANVD